MTQNHVPTELDYTYDHGWIAYESWPVTVGITPVATAFLGCVERVQLPRPGSYVTAGLSCGEFESRQLSRPLYAPVSGEVVEVNTDVLLNPWLVGRDPYQAGWLFKVRLTEWPGHALSPAEYSQLTEAEPEYDRGPVVGLPQ